MSESPVDQTVTDIIAAGGAAAVNGDDGADWAGAEHLIDSAVSSYRRLDVLVNNAGFLLVRMLAGMSEGERDAVVRVHLKRHSRHCVTPLRTGGPNRRQAMP